MMITSQAQALDLLDDGRERAALREAAIRYLKAYPTSTVIARLVQALQDDDVGVRWEASTVLAQLGEIALPEVLRALTDPKRVGDPRLRDSAYHILHSNQAVVPVRIIDLLEALRGPAADIASLVEANRVLRELRQQQSVKSPVPVKPEATGLAQLTGRLTRLRIRRLG